MGLTNEKPKVKKPCFFGGLKWKEIFYTLLLTFTWEETTLVEDNTDQQLGCNVFCFFFLIETESNIKTTIFVELKFSPFAVQPWWGMRHRKLQWIWRSINNGWLSTVYLCLLMITPINLNPPPPSFSCLFHFNILQLSDIPLFPIFYFNIMFRVCLFYSRYNILK